MKKVKLGIKENYGQIVLLIVANVFVGAIVGIERTVLPLLGEEQFGIASASAALSFIISFGFSKAIVNYFAGHISDRYGRKHVLIFGWVIGLFVPILIIVAHAWWVIVVANILLGINQGLTWSMTVNMKIDIAKSSQRGTVVGLNEFAGYSGVALMAMLSGFVATSYSLRPEPFYIGIGIVLVGILLSVFIRDTSEHLKSHEKVASSNQEGESSPESVFKETTWKNRNLSSISFAGLATNLKDGMAWGLFPMYFTAMGLSVSEIGVIVALYPAAWGFFQLFTGVWSDRVGRKQFIVYGMWVQAVALWLILLVDSYPFWIVGAIVLGLGTAMVYPTLQAAVSDVAAPSWRASSMGVYRFWRDTGYAFGAIIAGLIADWLNVTWAIGLVAIFPLLAGFIAKIRLEETLSKNT